MKRFFFVLALLICLPWVTFGQQREPQLQGYLAPDGTFMSVASMAGAPTTMVAKYLQVFSSAPTCSRKGQVYFDSALGHARVCTATPSTWETLGGGGGGGITNSAGNNVIMKSNGTNAVASDLTNPSAGLITVGSASQTGSLKLQGSSGDSSNSVTLAVDIGEDPNSNWTFKFPHDGGTSGSGLITDGSGNTSWSPVITGSGTVLQVAYFSSAGVIASNASGPIISDNGIFPTVAAADTVGSASLPFSSAFVGNAANNSAQLTGTFTGNRVVTFPDSDTKIPIVAQILTFAGPTAARTITFPDAAITVARTDAANAFTGVQSMTSPAVTTSLTTPSTTFALLNTTATTVNAFGAATTVNTGAAATQIWNFGGSTTASEFRFLEPSGSGANYSAFKAVAQGANITYSLPATVGAAGTFLRDAAGNGVLDWSVPAGAGDVVGPSSATDNAVVRFDATTGKLIQNSVVTIADTTGNISTPGTLSTGVGSGNAGTVTLTEGTAPSLTANAFSIYAPADVAAGGLAYITPAAAATGFMLATNAAGVMTISHNASTGTGNVVMSASPTLTGTIGAASATFSSLTSGRVVIAGASGLLADDADLTFATDTLTATKIIGSTSITNSSLTSGRVMISGASGIEADDSDLTFSTDTLTATKAVHGGATSLLLGTAGSNVGDIGFRNATSGTITLAPPTGALGTVTATLFAATDTIVGKATTDTLTNKTLDVEGAGNVVTTVNPIYFAAAGCNNATASSFWDLPTATPAVAACVTGTNTQKGVLQYADTSGGFSAQTNMLLPADFSGTVDARIIWRTSATTGNAKFSFSTICTAVDATETDDPAFNTASTVTTAAAGTANRLQSSAITTVTITTCAAGEYMHFKLFRDGNDAADTIGASLDVIGVEVKLRRAQ